MCDEETGIACWEDIDPLNEVLIARESVTPERYADFDERGAVWPRVPPIASVELTVMTHTISELANGKITPRRQMPWSVPLRRYDPR